jgi:hypothetical protein
VSRSACLCMRVGWVTWRRAHDAATYHKPGARHTVSCIARARVSWRVHEESGRVVAGLGLERTERCRGSICILGKICGLDGMTAAARTKGSGKEAKTAGGVWRRGWREEGG